MIASPQFAKGKVTYFAAAALATHSILGFLLGLVDANAASQGVLEALAIAGLRRAVY